MPLSPQDVASKQFTVVRLTQGYKMDEVDAFLDEVEGELGRLLRDNDELRTSTSRGGAGSEDVPSALSTPLTPPAPAAAPVVPTPTPPPPPAPVVAAAPPASDAAVRMLELAQRTADQAVAEAKAEAQRILDAARGEHARMASDLEGQRTALQAKVDELRAFEREYRTRLRGYLESQLRDLDARGGVAPAPPASPAVASSPPAPSTPPSSTPPAGPPPTPPVASPPIAVPPSPPVQTPPSRPFSPVPSPISDTPAAPPVQPD